MAYLSNNKLYLYLQFILKNIIMRIFYLFILCVLISTTSAYSQLGISSIFSDDMVIQQNDSVPIWGYGTPSETVSINGSWNENDTVKTIVDNEGCWKAKLYTRKFGGPYKLIVSNQKEKIILSNIMLGEVWLCSGQSNMEWSADYGIDNGKAEIDKASYNKLRIFHIPKRGASTPQIDCRAKWETCSPETMRKTSATAYFFGRYISEKLNIPVGIIVSAWGGTPAEVWTPSEIIMNDSVLRNAHYEECKWWPVKPGVSYNQMINPILPFSIAGCIWYQGESNHENASSYCYLMEKMLNSWRSRFKNNFPFYYVQIAPHTYKSKSNTPAILREQQFKFLSESSNVGMINISDLVSDVNDIHPRNKKAIGERLAYMALDKKYGKFTESYESPIFSQCKRTSGKLILEFKGNFDYLKSDTKQIEGLMLAGSDGIFRPINGIIKGRKIIIQIKKLSPPYQVNYCFDDSTVGSLKSNYNIPVLPFRTTITE